MTTFIFDLDGTITQKETLPLIANHFGVQEKIEILTRETVLGRVPFVESFIRRVHILGKFPVNEINDLLSEVTLYPEILAFIRAHKDNCCIATGNLDCWIEKLVKKIGCKCFCSEGLIENNQVIKIKSIQKKEEIVRQYQAVGKKVVYIGDGNNDVDAMRLADVAIAAGLTHWPAIGAISAADYLVLNEEALCRQLNQLL